MNLPTPAIVAERGVERLPRLALILLCAAYVLPGIFGRDPWRNADLTAFGFMASIAEGRAGWFTPALAGLPADGALLPYWLGAWALQWRPEVAAISPQPRGGLQHLLVQVGDAADLGVGPDRHHHRPGAAGRDMGAGMDHAVPVGQPAGLGLGIDGLGNRHGFASQRRLGGLQLRRLDQAGIGADGIAGGQQEDVAADQLAGGHALLGAVALGDIGKHFPDTDAQFKGIDSRILLREVKLKLATLGYAVLNVDLTIVAQAPKMAPHIPLMRERIAEDLGMAIDRVNVKATTTEGMGFEGRGEGISSMAVTLLEKA